jgi:hypothetical protein
LGIKNETRSAIPIVEDKYFTGSKTCNLASEPFDATECDLQRESKSLFRNAKLINNTTVTTASKKTDRNWSLALRIL